jgi:hypothetical protein
VDSLAGKALQTGFLWVLEGCFYHFELPTPDLKKIFQKNPHFFKKSVCIWEKKGYNRMD